MTAPSDGVSGFAVSHVTKGRIPELEEMVLAADIDYRLGIDEACENVRRWLRAEIESRLRKRAAKGERVEVACRSCGEPTDVSQGHGAKVIPRAQGAAPLHRLPGPRSHR